MQFPLFPEVKPEFCTSGTFMRFMRLPSSRENTKLAITKEQTIDVSQSTT